MIITDYTYNKYDSSKFKTTELLTKILEYNTKHIIKIIYLKNLIRTTNIEFSEIDKADIYYFSYKIYLKSFPELKYISFSEDDNTDSNYPYYLYDIIIRNKRYFLIVNPIFSLLLTPKLFINLSIFKNKSKRNLEFDTPFEEYMIELAFLNNLEIARGYFRKLYTFDKRFFIENDT